MAQDVFGLYTIVRAGPYIAADWAEGGFPPWLLAIGNKVAQAHMQSQWLRSDDPVYLEWAKHWMNAVCPVIAAEQVSRKPRGHAGVILIQIEDEYDLCDSVSGPAKETQLRTLYQAAVANRVDIPLITCDTSQCRDSDDPLLAEVFDSVNLSSALGVDSTTQRLNDLESAQPDAPVMVTELFEAGRSRASVELAGRSLLAIESGATVVNCDAYAAAASIGPMLRTNGRELARSRQIPCQFEAASQDVSVSTRLAVDNRVYLFFRNRSLTEAQRGIAVIWVANGGEIQVDYDLKPQGSNLLTISPGLRWPFDTGRVIPAPGSAYSKSRSAPDGVEWLLGAEESLR